MARLNSLRAFRLPAQHVQAGIEALYQADISCEIVVCGTIASLIVNATDAPRARQVLAPFMQSSWWAQLRAWLCQDTGADDAATSADSL
jgi:hypothetical protein